MVSNRTAEEEETRVEVAWRDTCPVDTHESELFKESLGSWAPPEPQPTAQKGRLFIPAP